MEGHVLDGLDDSAHLLLALVLSYVGVPSLEAGIAVPLGAVDVVNAVGVGLGGGEGRAVVLNPADDLALDEGGDLPADGLAVDDAVLGHVGDEALEAAVGEVHDVVDEEGGEVAALGEHPPLAPEDVVVHEVVEVELALELGQQDPAAEEELDGGDGRQHDAQDAPNHVGLVVDHDDDPFHEVVVQLYLQLLKHLLVLLVHRGALGPGERDRALVTHVACEVQVVQPLVLEVLTAALGETAAF
mmetsp:Transcript_1596/g.2813  ORF Transcript_1596/g.2813 Transcript_1596/m.2813 type:complete len:243 (-) Transcript_1596:113-841(-)